MRGTPTGAIKLQRNSGMSYKTCCAFIHGGNVSIRTYRLLAPIADRLGIAYVKQDAFLAGVAP